MLVAATDAADSLHRVRRFASLGRNSPILTLSIIDIIDIIDPSLAFAPRVLAWFPKHAALSAGTMRVLLLAFLLASIAPFAAYGHGTPDERAAVVERRILDEPTNPNHYLRRAALAFERGDMSGTRASLATAAAFGASDLDLAELQARVELSEDHPQVALATIEAIGAAQRTEQLLRLRALALRELGQRDKAAEAFATVLSAAARPSPDDFLEAARAYRAAGDETRALAVLDAGVARLGKLAALEQTAIEIEVERKDFPAAIRRLDALLKRNPGNRSWVERREQIVRLAHDAHPKTGAIHP